MKDIYEIFEFNLIKEQLEKFAAGELAKIYVKNLTMFDNEDDLSLSLQELKEGIRYCYKYASLPFHYHQNLIPQLVSLKKGGIGSKEFFYQISYFLENIKLIKEDFKEEESFPLLKEIITSLKNLELVKQKIDRIISPNLDILDSASNNLMRIRNKISRLESSLGSLSNTLVDKYRNYLSEGHGALKNGIFTLMVKSSFKNRVPGITLAISDTGSTIFIEPQELIEVYNNIASLKEEEVQEIQSILKDLSQYVNSYNSDLLNDNYLLGKLDFIFARATYAISYNGEIASTIKQRRIKLENAAHPLIDKKKVVRNDFILNDEKMMVITGPNAGGKTVALKVVGLLIIMHQCGLALPIKEGGELCFFKNIFADIGDNQSLLDNLSTFSSHIVNIERIIEQTNENSLVIIDELGSGTSPLDGEAIGLGIIDYLLKKNCFSIISSHYEGIKSYALENEKILCASMIFDEKEIKPTYKLLLHVASASFGVEVASRLGLNAEIIKRAQKYIYDRKLSDKEIKIEVLNQAINENEKIKITLKEQEKELDNLKIELQRKIDQNNLQKAKIIAEAEEEKNKIIAQAKEEIDELFKEFKNTENKKLHQVIELKHQIDEKGKTIEEDDDNIVVDQIRIDDQVEIVASKVKGKVIRIDKNKVTIVTDSGLNLQIKLSQIRKCEAVKPSKNKVYVPDFVANMKKVSTECNVIGLTVKEAIPIIDKYLDDCVSIHYHQARIIHGSGTGKLRQAVHQYLKTSPFVESFRLGGQGEGGVGATVVYFK